MLRLFCVSALFFTSLTGSAQLPTPTPGLTVPNSDRPWAFEEFQGRKQLLPMHSTAVQHNNHMGSNTAKSLLGGPFYKPRMTTEVKGVHAATVVHTALPVLYLRSDPDPDAAESATVTWQIVPLIPEKDHRVVSTVHFTQFTGKAKRDDGKIDIAVESLPDHWIRITPRQPLERGEYALIPVFTQQDVFSTKAYDFRFDPDAPNATDAVF